MQLFALPVHDPVRILDIAKLVGIESAALQALRIDALGVAGTPATIK